jgi:hypothetical protein
MSRTRASLESDTPSFDGLIPLAPGADIVNTGATAFTITKIATGEFSLHYAAAAGAVVVFAGVTGLIFRTGSQDDVQEFFGSARAGGAQGLSVGNPITLMTSSSVAGSAVNLAVFSSVGFTVGSFVTVDTVASGVQEFAQITAIPDATHITVNKLANAHTGAATGGAPITQNIFTTPADVSGRPPFTGLSQLTPVTVARPKGISLTALQVTYLITGANLTVPTIGMFAVQYPNLTAPTVTTLIAQATNNLQTATNAQAYTTPIPVPIANRGFIVTPNTLVAIEMDFNVGAATTIDIIGMTLSCAFNYD